MSKAQAILNLIETITPEQRKEEVDFAKRLKATLTKELGVPIKVTAMKSMRPNTWIEVRVANFGKDVIPNDFRKKIMKVMGWSAMNSDDVNYGNIRSNSVALSYLDWKKVGYK